MLAELKYSGSPRRFRPYAAWESGLYVAKQHMAVARDIYVDEWEHMSPLIRPAEPVVTPERARSDKFITLDDYYYLTATPPWER